jgi:hypothetical protein
MSKGLPFAQMVKQRVPLYTLTSANYENFVQKENFQKIDGMWKWYTESTYLEGELDAGTYYVVLYNHEL